MALIKCPDCGTDVSDAAAACPKCARPIAARTVSQPASKPRRASGGIFWLVVVVLLFWVYFKTKSPDEATVNIALPVAHQESAQATEQPTQVAQAAVVTMTPAQLYQRYSANEVATDQAIAGRVIQITAPVKSIDKDFTDSAILHFATTGDEFQEMGVTLEDSQKPQAAKLSQGQVVTVQCKTMRRIVQSPMGGHCVFADPAPDISTSDANQAPAQGAAAAPTAPDGPQPAQQGSQAGEQVVSHLSQQTEPAEATSAALTAPAATVPTTAVNSNEQTRVAGADAGDVARYAAAIQSAIVQQWERPKVMPNGSCLVHIVQTPGGTIVSATVDQSCPYDDPTKASVENAVFGAQPLPYSGFEGVFQRNIDVTLSP